MSMTPDTEQFDNLRRLLAIKRHEQPPPGYFKQFSSRILIRIREGERGEEADWLTSLFGEAPWLHRIWSFLEARPVLTGTAGALASALLVAAVVFTEKPEAPQDGQSHLGLVVSSELAAQPIVGSDLERGAVAEFGSTNGVLLPDHRDAFFALPAQTVSFVVPGGK